MSKIRWNRVGDRLSRIEELPGKENSLNSNNGSKWEYVEVSRKPRIRITPKKQVKPIAKEKRIYRAQMASEEVVCAIPVTKALVLSKEDQGKKRQEAIDLLCDVEISFIMGCYQEVEKLVKQIKDLLLGVDDCFKLKFDMYYYSIAVAYSLGQYRFLEEETMRYFELLGNDQQYSVDKVRAYYFCACGRLKTGDIDNAKKYATAATMWIKKCEKTQWTQQTEAALLGILALQKK